MKKPIFSKEVFTAHFHKIKVEKKSPLFMAEVSLMCIGATGALLIYYITRDLTAALAVLAAGVLLGGAFTVLAHAKAKKEVFPDTLVRLDFMSRLVSYLASGENYLSSVSKAADEIKASSLKDSLEDRIKSTEQNETNYVSFSLDSSSFEDAEAERLINLGFVLKNPGKKYAEELLKAEEAYKKKNQQKPFQPEDFSSGLILSLFISYTIYILYMVISCI